MPVTSTRRMGRVPVRDIIAFQASHCDVPVQSWRSDDLEVQLHESRAANRTSRNRWTLASENDADCKTRLQMKSPKSERASFPALTALQSWFKIHKAGSIYTMTKICNVPPRSFTLYTFRLRRRWWVGSTNMHTVRYLHTPYAYIAI